MLSYLNLIVKVLLSFVKLLFMKGGDMLSIKVERVKANKSVNEVCAEIGVSRVTFWSWENGKWKPSEERLRALAKCFGCSVDDLQAPAK